MGRCSSPVFMERILFSEVSEMHHTIIFSLFLCILPWSPSEFPRLYIHIWFNQLAYYLIPTWVGHLTTQLIFIKIKLSWIFAFYDIAFNWQCSQWHLQLQKVSRVWETAVLYIGTKFRLSLSSVIWTITMETSVTVFLCLTVRVTVQP